MKSIVSFDFKKKKSGGPQADPSFKLQENLFPLKFDRVEGKTFLPLVITLRATSRPHCVQPQSPLSHSLEENRFTSSRRVRGQEKGREAGKAPEGGGGRG